MHSVPMDVFFSCSFQKNDERVNDFFMAIGRALSMRFVNVSTGSPANPPAEAKNKIERSQAVLAVCTRRIETKDGKWIMPAAVHDEISLAYSSDTPLLMIIEEDVDFSGFKSNFGTYLSFKRENLNDSDFIQRAVEAIHNLKLHALGENPHLTSGLSESFAEYINHMAELRSHNGSLTWHYSTTKKLVYTHASKRVFPLGVWATVPVKDSDTAKPMDWQIKMRDSSRGITLDTTIENHTASCVEARVRLSPPAEEGDYVEYFTQSSSHI